MPQDKSIYVKVDELSTGQERGTGLRVDGLIWATIETAAQALETSRSELITELLIEGLAARGFFAVRLHGLDGERTDLSEFFRNHQEAVVIEHSNTEVLEELVVRLPVQP